MRFHTPRETLVALDLARGIHTGKIQLPGEIIATRRLIQRQTRQLLLFKQHFGLIDYACMEDILQLMPLKDELYGRWIREQARGLL